MAGIVDWRLWITDMPPEVFPIRLHREAMHLQHFTPTRYVSGRGFAYICTWRPLSKLLYRHCVAIMHACSYTVALSLGGGCTTLCSRQVLFFCLCTCVSQLSPSWAIRGKTRGFDISLWSRGRVIAQVLLLSWSYSKHYHWPIAIRSFTDLT